MRRAFAETMLKVGHRDSSLVVLVGDISHGILKPFAEAFPSRYYNVGICEPTIVNMASGLSKVGLNPVAHTIAPFLIERSFEQLKLDFEYEKQSVNLVSVGSGFDYSQLGCTHHCYDDIALMRQLPSSKIFVPGTAEEFKTIFEAHYQDSGIKYYRLSEQSNEHWESISAGTYRVAKGQDVTVVALGTRLDDACVAVDSVAPSLRCDLFYVNQVKPFDYEEIADSVKRTGRLVVVEEHSVVGGLGDACLQALAGMPFAFRGLGVSDFIHQYGSHADLLDAAGLATLDIVTAIKEVSKTQEAKSS